MVEKMVNKLRDTLKEQEMYDDKRDNLNYNTSFLSAYINLVVYQLMKYIMSKKIWYKTGIIRELIWRIFCKYSLSLSRGFKGSCLIRIKMEG